jgi:hypothetical protein
VRVKVSAPTPPDFDAPVKLQACPLVIRAATPDSIDGFTKTILFKLTPSLVKATQRGQRRSFMKQLADKSALITGASQGLGRELALAYAREDVRGFALVARGKKQLQKLQSEITNIAPTAIVETVQADLGSMTDIERLAAITLEACGGRLDILVNNASTLGPVPMPYLLDYPQTISSRY